MAALTQHPTASLATGFAAFAVIAGLFFALGPLVAALFTPVGAQALIFAFVLLAICSGAGCSLSALREYLDAPEPKSSVVEI